MIRVKMIRVKMIRDKMIEVKKIRVRMILVKMIHFNYRLKQSANRAFLMILSLIILT